MQEVNLTAKKSLLLTKNTGHRLIKVGAFTIMEKYFILTISFLFCISVEGQILFERSLFDHIWLFGGSDIRMDFNYTPPLITQEDRPFNFHATNASICDENGGLLFYTNGIRIANSDHQFVENGYRINQGPITEAWINSGNRIVQGAIALQHPDSFRLFDLIYVEAITTTLEDGQVINMIRRIHHALIDMDGNEGQGSVLEKDFPLLLDTLDGGKLTASRHGNGRDWWIVVPYLNANEYHRFLLDSDGIQDYGVINTGNEMKWGLGQAVFSPDGTKYINMSLHKIGENYLAIYDFDRCTGQLTNPIVIENDSSVIITGVAISENGRFLYESLQYNLYQYDLEAEDVVASRIKIAEYDGYYEGNNPGFLWTTFFLAQLAPNGKIYINNATSTKHLHTIEEPNKRGMASRVEQHNVTLPTWNQRTMPNYPYYGLGPWDGSPCDTLNINNPIPEAAFEYTPDSLEQIVEFFDASHYAYEWLWDFGDDTPLDTLHHPVHTYTQPGTYEVCLTVSNVTGMDTYCDTLYLGVTATDYVFSRAAKVTLYPNPVDDQLFVHYTSTNNCHIQLLNTFGKVLLSKQLEEGNHKFTINVAGFPSGLYFLQLYDDGKIVSQKIIITH